MKKTSNAPRALPSLLKMKCPNCREGNMFKNKSIFPLTQLLDMPKNCTVCGQPMELEVGFYYGTGYVSYAVSVALFIAFAVIFQIVVGFDWQNNSVFQYLIASVTLIILLQPWIMRYSRVLYLWGFVKYGKGSSVKTEE